MGKNCKISLKKGIRNVITLNLFLLVLGIIYFFLVLNNEGFYCILYSLTKIKCPSCGITTMLLHIVDFNFLQAFESNPFMFLSLPFLMVGYVISNILYIKNENINHQFNLVFYLVYLILLIMWMILRNIFGL